MRASVKWVVLGVGLWLGACSDDAASPDAGSSVSPAVSGAPLDGGTSLLPGAPSGADASTVPVVPIIPTVPPIQGGASDGGTPNPGTPDGGGPGVPPATGAGAPVLPATGDCPKFATGTATIGGLSGISLQVGAKKEGGGSLIFYWHGTGSTSAEVNGMVPAAVRNEILQNGGIIVSPQGSLRSGGDCSGTNTFSKDDFKVADLIAACAVRDHNIDPRRIYTTGCSAGGLQAGCMASLRAGYIAAAVPNSGGLVFPQAIQQSSAKPAIMTMHGGSSDVVVVTFSETSKTLDNQFKKAGSYVVNCNHGGGHCRAPAPLYTAGWEFMKSHPYGVTPEPYGATLPSSFPDYCKPF
jgi:predicted esterase